MTRQQEIIRAYQDGADQYERWFDDKLDDNSVFRIELEAVRTATADPRRPALEIGVGPGVFARELGIEFGIDPALAPLQKARARGIAVATAVGEALPFRDNTLETIYLLFTLCFLANPGQTLRECRRILRPGGHLVIGFIPATSTWGQRLERRKADGDPYYRHASLHTVAQLRQLLHDNKYTLTTSRSTLYQQPSRETIPESSRNGADETAGFCVLVGRK